MAVSALAALFIAEMFLRYLYDPLDVNRFVRETPYGKYREMLIKDPILGFRLKPNSHVVFEREDVDDYKMEVRINSIGIRDVEYSVAKPDGVVRIIFVGDSIVFGAGIELDQTMAKLLEKLLNEHTQGGVKYEVMNWGVGSYGLSQELGLLKTAGAARYQPDLLLVGTGPNDFGASLFPNTYEEQTGLLATADVQANLLTQPTHGVRSLKLYRLSGYAVRRLLSRYATWFVPHDVSSSESALSTRKDLHGFKEYADSLGIPIGFVLFPGGELLDPATSGNTYQRAQYDFFREQFTRMGVPWLDSLPAIREATQRRGRAMYVQWDNLHFNAEGNQVIARELLGFVRSISDR
jgi:lysophospholipase L1-like esterase